MAIFARPWPSKATSLLWTTRAHSLAPFLLCQTLLAWLAALLALAHSAATGNWALSFAEPAAAALVSTLDLYLCTRRSLHPAWPLVESVVIVLGLVFALFCDIDVGLSSRAPAWGVLLAKIVACFLLALVYFVYFVLAIIAIHRLRRMKKQRRGMRAATPPADGGEASVDLQPVPTSSSIGRVGTADPPPEYADDVSASASQPPFYAGPSSHRPVMPAGKGSMTVSEAESDTTSLASGVRGHRAWY